MVRYDEIDWNNPKWKDVKETVFWIDTYDCGPGEVARALQLLTTWIEKHKNLSSSSTVKKEERE